MGFKSGVTAKEQGIDISRKFRYVGGSHLDMFEKGDKLIVKMESDKGANFNRESDNYYQYAGWSEVEYADEPESRFKVGDKIIGNKKANEYGITIEDWEGDVTEVCKNKIKAEGIDLNGDLATFSLIADRFDLIEESNEKIAIHCPTQEIYNEVVQHMLDKGWSWCNGGKNIAEDGWESDKERTCIWYKEDFEYSAKEWYKASGFTIKNASYVLGEVPSLSESGLTTAWEVLSRGFNTEAIKPTSDYEPIHPNFHYGKSIVIEPSPRYSEMYRGMFDWVTETKEDNINNSLSNNNMGLRNFAKNLVLTKEEKLLRKHNLKDECGTYSDEYRAIVLDKLMVENETHVLELVEKKEKEDKPKK